MEQGRPYWKINFPVSEKMFKLFGPSRLYCANTSYIIRAWFHFCHLKLLLVLNIIDTEFTVQYSVGNFHWWFENIKHYGWPRTMKQAVFKLFHVYIFTFFPILKHQIANTSFRYRIHKKAKISWHGFRFIYIFFSRQKYVANVRWWSYLFAARVIQVIWKYGWRLNLRQHSLCAFTVDRKASPHSGSSRAQYLVWIHFKKIGRHPTTVPVTFVTRTRHNENL